MNTSGNHKLVEGKVSISYLETIGQESGNRKLVVGNVSDLKPKSEGPNFGVAYNSSCNECVDTCTTIFILTAINNFAFEGLARKSHEL